VILERNEAEHAERLGRFRAASIEQDSAAAATLAEPPETLVDAGKHPATTASSSTSPPGTSEAVDPDPAEMRTVPGAVATSAAGASTVERDTLIRRSWSSAADAAKRLGCVRGHVTRLVRGGELEGHRVDGRLYINPASVRAHPRYVPEPADASVVGQTPSTAVGATATPDITYECAACENVVTLRGGERPGRCPKCQGQGSLIRQRPRR
jgi:excisionase family DNA binding protein